MGLWVFLLSSIIGYPAMYLFQRLFINTLAESPECKDYPSVISGYLGKNWGILLGALYFVMLVIWMFVYSTAITNDSASYLHTFGVTEGLLSDSPFYGLVLICILVAISSRGEKITVQNLHRHGADQATGSGGAGRLYGGYVASV